MSNLRNALHTQQKITDAVNRITDYFAGEVSYEEHLEQMLSAQTQIIGLMELAKMRMITNREEELMFKTDELTFFLRDVYHYLQMLKPFIELAEEKGGEA